ncbi:MAG: hypothetical protein JSS67_09200 [Bacteroidetes bacterium]|nr:hypothetical protein [Bacteroidota bacterium]
MASFFLISCNKSADKPDHDKEVRDYHSGLVPLTDIDTNYMGYPGKLFPGNSNTPTGEYANDLQQICSDIKPLDENGHFNPFGKVGFVSVGPSTSLIMMNALIEKMQGNKNINPAIWPVPLGQGGMGINQLITNSTLFWDTVAMKLQEFQLSPNQIQVVYFEEDDNENYSSAFPERPLDVKEKLKEGLQLIKTKFPNVRVAYILARTTTIYMPIRDDNKQQEPIAYYLGFADKWLIEDQINGDPGLAYKGDNPLVPIITWGPYQWCDGDKYRSDGFNWLRTDTDDGLHPNDQGSDKLSTMFLNFLLNDEYAKIWFAK